jgi:hypothetical protein
MAVVTFDPAAFKIAYPGFASLPDPQVQNAFGLACLYLSNTDASIVQDVTIRATLLNLLTAHICKILYGENGQPPTAIAGRISSATEGSVSITMEALPQRPGMAWYYSTSYGAMYWEASAPYRIAKFVPGFPSRSY